MLFLRVENKVKHIPDIDFLCVLGESTSRGEDNKIGQFGTGFLYSLALFSRNNVLDDCKICLGKDVYNPIVKTDKRKTATGEYKNVSKICLKKQNGGTFDLNVSTGFGEVDWTDVTMGVREVVSNAIDNAIPGSFKYEIVSSNQCNAKDGTIRFYIPIIPEIGDYVDGLAENFICIKPTYNENVKVLAKTNLDNVKIYRKGAKVGSFYENSLFNYNVLVKIDESRVVDRGEAREECASALLKDSRLDQLEKFLSEVVIDKNEDLWESRFDSYNMSPKYIYDGDKTKVKFKTAAEKALAGRIPCKDAISSLMIEKKNMRPVTLKDGYYDVFKFCGVKIDTDFLDDSEALGNTISEPTIMVTSVLFQIWNKLKDRNLTNGREIPLVKCFNSAVNSGSQTFGRVDPNYTTIFIHENISNDTGLQLYQVMLEELTHYITRSGDYTRDFQSYVVILAAKLLME